MRRLIRWMVLVGVVIAVLAGSAQWAGRALSPPTNADMLHLDDCHLPCWIGIVPGQTRLDDARAQILNRFPHDLPTLNLLAAVAWSVHVTRGGFNVYLIVPAGTSAHITDADPVINGIELEPDGDLNVGDVIRLLGAPTTLRITGSADQKYLFTTLYFDGVGMSLATDDFKGCGPLFPWSTIRSLLISNDSPNPRLIQPWQGFRSCYHPREGPLVGW